jgi:hypothetical protein
MGAEVAHVRPTVDFPGATLGEGTDTIAANECLAVGRFVLEQMQPARFGRATSVTRHTVILKRGIGDACQEL